MVEKSVQRTRKRRAADNDKNKEGSRRASGQENAAHGDDSYGFLNNSTMTKRKMKQM